MELTFASCVAPVSCERFVSDCLSQSVRAFPGEPERFKALVTLDEIDNALLRITIYDGMVRLLTSTGDIARDKYLEDSDGKSDGRCFNTSALRAHMLKGAILGLFGAESLFRGVNKLCRSIENSLLADASALLVVSLAAGKPGPVHWDGPDIFVCQIHGRKRWPVFQPAVRYPLQDGAYRRNEGAESPMVLDEILRPGDALYVPGGWPHRPVSLDDISVHVAFSFARASGMSLLRFVLDVVARNEFARSPLPVQGTREDRRDYLDKLREVVLASLSEDVTEPYCVAQRLWRQAGKSKLFERHPQVE